MYSFGRNNPLGYTDPTGLISEHEGDWTQYMNNWYESNGYAPGTYDNYNSQANWDKFCEITGTTGYSSQWGGFGSGSSSGSLTIPFNMYANKNIDDLAARIAEAEKNIPGFKYNPCTSTGGAGGIELTLENQIQMYLIMSHLEEEYRKNDGKIGFFEKLKLAAVEFQLGLAFKWLETKSATVNLFADKASKWGPYYTAEQINEALDEVMLGECITIVGFLEVRAAAKINEQIRNVIFSKQFKFDLQFFANKGAGKTIPDIADSRLGKKLVDHAADYGLTKSKEGAAAYRQIIQNALKSTTEVRKGTWKTLGECEFWISGNNVSIIKNGTWISTFPLTKPGTVEYIMSLPIVK